jgi:ATP-dependent 26S proteasome regulatory subunit
MRLSGGGDPWVTWRWRNEHLHPNQHLLPHQQWPQLKYQHFGHLEEEIEEITEIVERFLVTLW